MKKWFISSLAGWAVGGVLLGACSHQTEVEPLTNDLNEGAANVLFFFDDGWSSQYTDAYPILDKYGMKGSIGVVTDLVGTKNYMDETNLNELYARGWDVINHTKSHPYLDSLSKDKQSKEILHAQKWLAKRGYERGLNTFVYPYGSYNADTLDVLADNDFVFARGVLDGEISGLGLEADILNVKTNLDAHEVKSRIDSAIKSGNTISLMFHRFGDEDDGHDMFYKASKLEEIVQYVAERRARGEVNALTVSEYVELAGREAASPTVTAFNGPINHDRLTAVTSGHPANGELQYYLPENVDMKEGTITLTGKRQAYGDYAYTSGKATTEGTFAFRFGRVEFSAQTNYEVGSFPAVWLLPVGDEYLPEIDVFESVGSEPGYVYYVNHYKEGEEMKKSFKGIELTDPTDFHHYAIEWTSESIEWYVDHELMHVSTEGIPQVPMYLIVNLAIGGNWSGPPTEETVFPMTFVVKDLKVITDEASK